MGLSPQVGDFEEWAVRNTLELLTIPGTITWRGTDAERPSTLDLTWRNLGATMGPTFFDTAVEWEGSLGSDHTLIWTRAVTAMDAQPIREEKKGFDLDPAKWEAWEEEFAPRLLSPSSQI